MIDLTGLMGALFTVICGLVAVYLIPWLKARVGAERVERVAYWVGVLVSAAEQLFQGTGRGAEKLRWVEVQLAGMGFGLDTERLRALIEAQVREMAAANAIVTTALEIPRLAEEVRDWQEEKPPEKAKQGA